MIKLSYLRIIQNIDANENHDITIDRIRAESTLFWFPQRREPLFSHALSRCIAQIRRFKFRPCGRADRNDGPKCQWLGEAIHRGWSPRIAHPSGARSQAHHGLFGRGSSPQSHRIRPTKCSCCQGSLATIFGKRSERTDFQAFFIRLGARYRRIRKRPRGIPSPQLYAYKTQKLQELETLYAKGEINLFYGDESHVCTEGYVPYGWQFPGENIYIPSERAKRLNIFGMTSRDNSFEGFCTSEPIDATKIADFLEQLSFGLDKKTFVVLDNASVHRNTIIRQRRPIWEKRGLFIFYIPPYSPHLNIIETLWRVMKGKWIRPQDYTCADTLFYATNRVLAAIGKGLRINYAHNAA
ncbi:IS630 family transposase [Bacteroides sp. 51]|nr:IS630 family transposase [Bacteroides sp. 51]